MSALKGKFSTKYACFTRLTRKLRKERSNITAG
jgi:hypothetical protein